MKTHRVGRGGFTLAELLVVIIIIGILASLVTVAVFRAMSGAEQAQVTLEASNMSTGLDSFKSQFGGYPAGMGTAPPPSSGPPFYGETEAEYESRVIRGVTRAFPQYVMEPIGSPAWTGSLTFPSGASDDYKNLISMIHLATVIVDPSKPIDDPANMPTSGAKVGLDFQTLDPAEVLVFWLGGLPARDFNDPKKFELTRFSADPQNPFLHQAFQPQRTPVIFEFEPSRLTDVDDDGWPEYVPAGKSTSGQMPPYVYFDSSTYDLRPTYPPFDPASGSIPALAQQWGLAKPYARDVDSNGRIQWVQPDTCQIIAAGPDGRYGAIPDDGSGTPGSEPYTVLHLFPSGQKVDPPFTPIGPFDQSEFDNATNFTTGTIEDGLTDPNTSGS